MHVNTHSKHLRVAVLSLCDLMRAGLQVVLAEMGVEVVVAAGAAALRQTLRAQRDVDLLVCDDDQLGEAIVVAKEYRLPLLVIAPTMIRALAIAGTRQVQGVVTLPTSRATLAEALDTIVVGERYLPFELAPGLSGVQLSERERELVGLDLQDVPTEEIARWMRIEVYTVYTYRSRIRKKLRKLDSAGQPHWVSAWLRRFPGH